MENSNYDMLKEKLLYDNYNNLQKDYAQTEKLTYSGISLSHLNYTTIKAKEYDSETNNNKYLVNNYSKNTNMEEEEVNDIINIKKISNDNEDKDKITTINSIINNNEKFLIKKKSNNTNTSKSMISNITQDIHNNNQKNWKKTIINIILGQFIAIVGVINGFSCDKIQNQLKLNYPLLLTFMYYIALFFLYFLIDRKISKPKYCYLLIALFDSQANFFNIFAFTQINLTFPFVINISTFMWTLFFTMILIKTYRYSVFHYIGVFISIVGIVLAVFGLLNNNDDTEINNKNNSSITSTRITNNEKGNPILGIILCIGASICYSLSSLFQEIYLGEEEDNMNEYLKWLGLFSSLFILIESFVMNEAINIFSESSSKFNGEFFIYFCFFLTSIISMTSFVPYYIRKCSASMFNVSLVFQIFWSYILTLMQGEPLVSEYKLI